MALKAQGNGILRQMPIHILVPPTISFFADGATDIQSRELLATLILDAIRIDPDDDNEEETARKEKEAEGMEVVLVAVLLACKNNGLTPVALNKDVRGNPATLVNQVISTIKEKLKVKGDE